MPSVDDRIVAMQFDNKSFEEKIATTIGSIDKLKTSLDFANATKNLGDLQKAGSNFNLNGIAAGVEGIAGKFTAMGAIAFSVIQNITDRAINAGISIVKSLSLDQVISGFREYETNMNAIQTVLANTQADGTSLNDVNAALDTLNTYSDQTIYNFGEMARNIGTFTAAGVDLDTSVNAIKGIANLAAISGSNSQQASTAMYQLSQALASGSVKLMDWNSIVNAGMGGEVFQKALFTTGQALGTIKDVPLGQTFDEWKAAGNTFRNSLESGWLTADVLTNTLEGFTGDLTDAQLRAIGYTEDQIVEIQKLGQTGQDAATKVKTLTQLISTVKESVGSGWSASFRIIIGDFEQAKELFTGLSNAIGGFVGRQADARNELLKGWADLGGRTQLIKGLQIAFEAIGRILKPIGEAFRSIFPKKTAQDLFELTMTFQNFARKLRISGETADKLRTIFAGVFGALEIGWTIIKETAKLIGTLFSAFSSQNGSGILDFFTEIGKKLAFFNGALVAGGGIEDFFKNLTEIVQNPGKFIDDLKTKVVDFFSGIDFGSVDGLVEAFVRVKDAIVGVIDKFDPTILDGIKEFFAGFFGNFDLETSNSVEGGFGRLGDRLSWLGDVMGKVWGAIKGFWDGLMGFGGFMKGAFTGAIDAIGNLGPSLVEAAGNVDFDKVLSLIQTGIAAVFAGGFANISKNGLKFDFTGGALSSIADFFGEFKGIGKDVKKSLGEVTDTLEAMQLKLKAEALQKIAIAMAIMAGSMILLSTVDPIALAKALTAMAVGFGQLATTMGVLNTMIQGPASGAKLGLVATGLILMAGAILILSAAVKIFSTMDSAELAKGLGSVVLLIGVLVGAAKLLQGNTAGMITAGVGMTAMAVALNLLAIAVKIFATMSWEELAKGLGAVAVGLGLIVAMVHLLPDGAKMVSIGIGILLIGAALNLLATAMKIIATMSWEDIGKGLVGVAGGLLAIAIGLKFMPKGPQMIAAGVGLLAISFALNLMATALKLLATMSWSDIAKSLITMAGALIILVVAAKAMESGVAGAIAIALLSASLGLLVKVLKGFASMSWGELAKGLIGLAASLLVLGGLSYILAPLVPVMIGLGIAMFALGAGFALFGIGAHAVALAFGLMAAAGKQGIDLLMYAIDQLLTRLPEMATVFAEAIGILVVTILEAVPEMVLAIGEIIGAILRVIIDNVPLMIEALVTFIQAGLSAIRTLIPDFVVTGYEVLVGLLKGLRDNIAEVTTLVAEIIVEFLGSLTAKIPDIVAAGLGLLAALIQGVADNIQLIVDAGINLLVNFLTGIAQNIGDLLTAAGDIVTEFITGIGNVAQDIITAGADMIVDLITGISDSALDIVAAGAAAIVSFVEGVSNNIQFVIDEGFRIIVEFINGIADSIETNAPLLREAGKNLAVAIADGLSFGLTSKVGDVANAASGLAGGAVGVAKSIWGIGGPSKVFCEIGKAAVGGMAAGLSSGDGVTSSVRTLGAKTTKALTAMMQALPSIIDGMPELAPVITPVLDLSYVQKDALRLGTILGPNPMIATSAYDQASFISEDRAAQLAASAEEAARAENTPTVKEVKFEQNNYSPEALSPAEIYRQTRNQIELAKEELSIV